MSFSNDAIADAMALVKGLETRYLKQLTEHLQAEIKDREKTDLAEAKLKILEIAKSVGMPVEQLMRGFDDRGMPRKPYKATKPSEVLYCDPNTTRTWSGRGMKPTWLKMLVDQGHTLESLSKPVA
ncbi:MAG: H-NS histone family protein [Pseudomonadota bacterium]